MRISVIVNNYNYQDYVIGAVESVLNQTVLADEIIVVDDRSSDQSAQLLQEKFADSETVKLILKDQNEGQLSAFQAGFLASSGDIICFLDADDLYKETYLENVLDFYRKHPECEFLFTCAEIFGNEERIASCHACTRDLGYSRISTLYRRNWVGHRTSTVSMRRHILDKIFPIPYLEDWRIRADDCLVYGASIADARKFYLAVPLVRYRVHGNNGYYGKLKARPEEYFQQYEVAIERLFKFWIQKFDYPHDLDQLAPAEFRSIPQPTQKEFEMFWSISYCSNASKFKKVLMLLSVCLHFLRGSIANNRPKDDKN